MWGQKRIKRQTSGAIFNYKTRYLNKNKDQSRCSQESFGKYRVKLS